MTLEITSSAFSEGEMIPTRYTCDGPDVSPDLTWSGVPETALSLSLICDDPDAPMGTWVHCVLYDLPKDTRSLPEGVQSTETLAGGGAQGRNDFGRIGYGGPCPPPGRPHRYFFKLYALDTVLSDLGEPTKDALLAAMEGHIIARGELMGTYQK